MKATVTTQTAPQVSASDVVRSFGKCLALCLMYVFQSMAKAFGMAQRSALFACQWLNTRHNFADKEEPVTLTGWQFVGFCALIMCASVVLSIQW